MLTRNQLKEIFRQYDFSPLKRYGENYLIDNNIKDKIIFRVAPEKGDTILEIGPGLGALTIDLAESGADVIAVDKDPKACRILRELVGDLYPNLIIINADIIDFDIKKIYSDDKLKVVGNLPYYITTPIIEMLINHSRIIKNAVVMIQREVADRILAKRCEDEYSSLSCFLQYYTHPEYVHTVKHTCFYPAPEVDSAIIELTMLAKPPVAVKDEKLLFRIIRGAFNQRRKSIINSLSREEVLDISKDSLTQILESAEVSPTARPETLSLADFARIANSIDS